VARIHDGFRLAREDMERRGIGELMGPRQHGLTDAAMESLRSPALLDEARAEVLRLVAEDPTLDGFPALKAAAARRLEQTSLS